MIRNLWTDWTPTNDEVREVWFRAWDLPHGENTPGTRDHGVLREAIVQIAREAKYNKRPVFADIHSRYGKLRNDAIRAKPEDRDAQIEAEYCEKQHVRRIEDMKTWNPERMKAAREYVGRVATVFAKKTDDMSQWTRTYSGLVWAADQIIGGR